MVESCVHVPQLMKSLRRYRFDWPAWYSSNGVEFESDAPVIDWESDNVAGLIASRIYKVRNAIVHSKNKLAVRLFLLSTIAHFPMRFL